MSKTLFFSCLFLLATTFSIANDFQRKIVWEDKIDTTAIEPAEINPLKFDGSIFIDQTGLPYWFESFELDFPTADVVIRDTVFEPVNVSVPALETIQDKELTFKSDIGVSAGKSFLRLTILPFVRRTIKWKSLSVLQLRLPETQTS